VDFVYGSNPTLAGAWALWIFHCVAMVWLAAIIVTASDFVIAGTTAGWYFVRDDDAEGFEMIQENFVALKATSLTVCVNT
jgi:hypothetical protein